MREGSLRDLAEWLRNTPLSEAIWSALWLIRLLQAVHLLAAGVTCAAGLLIALRALGWRMTDQPFDAVWQRFAPWLGWGLAVMFVTGVGQTLGDPVREFTATSWWLKMALLLYAVLATLWLGRRLRDDAAPLDPPGRGTRLVAIALVLGWLAIVLLGRMIAYDLPFWGSLSLRT